MASLWLNTQTCTWQNSELLCRQLRNIRTWVNNHWHDKQSCVHVCLRHTGIIYAERPHSHTLWATFHFHICIFHVCLIQAAFKAEVRAKISSVTVLSHSNLFHWSQKSIIVLYIFLYSVQCCKSVKNGPVIPKSHNDITACFNIFVTSLLKLRIPDNHAQANVGKIKIKRIHMMCIIVTCTIYNWIYILGFFCTKVTV